MAKKTSKTKKKSKGKKLAVNNIPDLIHSLIEKGANSSEEIHREVAALPVKVLEGLLPNAARDIGKIQHHSIGAVYDTIRRVNDEVERFAVEVLKEAPALQKTAREAASSARKAVESARKTAKKAVGKATTKKAVSKKRAKRATKKSTTRT